MRLTARMGEFLETCRRSQLPGTASLLEQRVDICAYISKEMDKLRRAAEEDDLVLFERYQGSLRKAWRRVNELLAKEHVDNHADPEDWDLRYVEWLNPGGYMKLSSMLGEFYIVLGRGGPSPPEDAPAYSATEVAGWLQPAMQTILKTFSQLPATENPPGPGQGELSYHLHAQDTQVTWDVEFGKGVLRGKRKGFR